MHQRPCHTDLKSQMRSHSVNNEKLRVDQPENPHSFTCIGNHGKPKILVRQEDPERKRKKNSWRERKQLLLALNMHQHFALVTSYTPYFVWRAAASGVLNGSADAFLHV